jgi:hypothetical protein
MVSECEDGTWECSCIAWCRKFPRENCKHIRKAIHGGKGVTEVDPSWTDKAIKTMEHAIDGDPSFEETSDKT